METLLYSASDGIAHVTLNRPEKKNALSFQMFEELTQLGQKLAQDDSLRVVILSGAGDAFCAGIDISELMAQVANLDKMHAWLDQPVHREANFFQAPTQVWRDLPVPVIAALDGPVLGGGAQLALACDWRIAGPATSFSILESRWGLIPDMGITQSLPALMPSDRAMDLIMMGDKLDGPAAFKAGLVSQLADDPMAAATKRAQNLVAQSPDALRAGKALVQAAWGANRDALYLEAKLQHTVLGTPSQIEKAMASFQKRAPNFKK